MDKDEVYLEVKRAVIIDRALRVGDRCAVYIDSLQKRIGCENPGFVQNALMRLAVDGIMFTRRHTESGHLRSRARGPKIFSVRISRREAVKLCQQMGIDLSKERGLSETSYNSNRLSRYPIEQPSYSMPDI